MSLIASKRSSALVLLAKRSMMSLDIVSAHDNEWVISGELIYTLKRISAYPRWLS